MPYDPSHPRLNDIALHQIRRQPIDPHVTFIGGRTGTRVPVQDGERTIQPDLVIWIARHSVVPDQPQPRSVSLVEPQDSEDALINALVDAILPAAESHLAPLMPGRIEVADAATATMLREALAGIAVEVAVSEDMTFLETLTSGLVGDLHRHFTPIPPWDVPAQHIRDLAATAANLYRREPWALLDDTPPVEVIVNKYGITSFYLSVTYGAEETEGIVAYRSLDDYHRSGKIGFLTRALEDAGGEVINLDLPPEDIAQIEAAIQHPEIAPGEAITLFYEGLGELNPETLEEVEKLRLAATAHAQIPIFTRISQTEPPRRPTTNETRALRLALEAFGQFLSRQRDRLENEMWHFAPITATLSVKEGAERVPINVRVASVAQTFDPALQNAVLHLRVAINDDPTVWREIDVLAQQPLWELDHAIQEGFGWPVRVGSFLPQDPYDGEETYEWEQIEDTISSHKAPVGLMLHTPRDFCHYLFDIEEHGLSHRVRLLGIGKRERGVVYPLLVRSHGEIPSVFDPEDYELDVDFEDDDEDEDE